jgi:TonB family protein
MSTRCDNAIRLGVLAFVSVGLLCAADSQGSATDQIYKLSEVDIQPCATTQIKPRVPDELMRATHLVVQVVVEFTVNADGTVSDPVAIKNNDARYVELTRQAILKWRFSPAKVGGRSVRCRMLLPFNYDLSG